MDILTEVRKLALPDGHYCVIGSGILSAKGLREAHDLDILVSRELYDRKVSEGWEMRPWTKPGYEGRTPYLVSGEVELYLEVAYGPEGNRYLSDLVADAEVIEGIPFMSLGELMRAKRAYGRPKDFADIALIEEYLARGAG